MPFDGVKTTEKLDILIELVSKNQDIGQSSYCNCLWHECTAHPRLRELGILDLCFGDASPIPKSALEAAKFFTDGTPLATCFQSSFAGAMFGTSSKKAKQKYLMDLMEAYNAF